MWYNYYYENNYDAGCKAKGEIRESRYYRQRGAGRDC